MPLVKEQPGPWFNIKMLSYQYRKSHCGDETVVRPSYLHNGIFFILVRRHLYIESGRGIAMLSVDKFPYPRKQTRSNEFIPCSNNICDILKRFRSFKIPAITLIWPKSSYKHNVTRSYLSGKESGRRSESPLWRHQWRSFVFISHADDVKREIRLHISWLLTNQKRESARSMG